jgi:hypothetical protein
MSVGSGGGREAGVEEGVDQTELIRKLSPNPIAWSVNIICWESECECLSVVDFDICP